MVHPGNFRKYLFGIVLLMALIAIPAQAADRLPARTDAEIASETGIAEGWGVFRVDPQINITEPSQHSLKLDSYGYACVAFGGDHLYYAHYNGTSWSTEVVDSAWGVGRGAALALDSSGKAHISYFDANNNSIKYATNKWGYWWTETIAWDTSPYSDIAIDSWGDPSVVFFSTTQNKLTYRNYDSGIPAWTDAEIIASANSMDHNDWFSLAIDTSVFPNKPHVSYYDYYSDDIGDLNYAHYNASNNWVTELITGCGSEPDICRIGEYNSIALKPSTHLPSVAFSYVDSYYGEYIRVYDYNGSSWDFDAVSDGAASYISLAYDQSNYARVIWKENGLKYSWRDVTTGNWSGVATVDANASAGEWASLAVVGTTAKALHYNTATKNLIFVNHDRTSWLTPYTVASQGHNLGRCSSLAVDSGGQLQTSYYDATESSLRYARVSIGSAPSVLNTIDNGPTECFSIIQVNPDTNNPLVAYVRGGNLYLRAFSGGSWSGDWFVDSGINGTTDYYQAFGMEIDTSGYPHLAYRKGNDLWYTYWNGSAWSKNLIKDELATGNYVALALGPDNTPYVAYYGSSGLLHTTPVLFGWNSELISSESSLYGVALGTDHYGNVKASYLGHGAEYLTFTSRMNICSGSPLSCIWFADDVITTHAESYFSMAIEENDRPHLTAWVWSPWALGYFVNYGTTWTTQLVDTNVSVGYEPSIALSDSGAPRISYYDSLNSDLKIAYKLDQIFLPLVRR